MLRSSLLIPLGALLFAACDVAPPGVLTPIDTEPATPVVTDGDFVCDASTVFAEPRNGADFVHRTAPLVLHHPAQAPVSLSVYGPAGRVPGDLWLDDDRAFFLPWQPWAASAHHTWVLDVCGERLVGGFTAGAVLRPPTDEELEDVFVDVPYSLDLRVADWTSPVPRGAAAKDDKAMARVGYRFGPSFLTMVTSFTPETLTLRLAPAVSEMSGIYAQDACRAAVDLTVPRGEGAYVDLALVAVEAQANGEPVVLRELSFTLGLGRDGFEDGRLAGELDLRDYEAEDGRDGCRLFESLTGHACQPCSTDHVTACAPFEVRDVRGLVSDEAPERLGENG